VVRADAYGTMLMAKEGALKASARADKKKGKPCMLLQRFYSEFYNKISAGEHVDAGAYGTLVGANKNNLRASRRKKS